MSVVATEPVVHHLTPAKARLWATCVGFFEARYLRGAPFSDTYASRMGMAVPEQEGKTVSEVISDALCFAWYLEEALDAGGASSSRGLWEDNARSSAIASAMVGDADERLISLFSRRPAG